MKIMRPLGKVSVIVLAGIQMTACSGSLYDLPAPPPAEDTPTQAEQSSERAKRDQFKRDEAARQAVWKLYGLLSSARYEAAEQLLSQQTRGFLTIGDSSGDASEVLAAGQLHLPDGRTIEFEPIDFLLGGKIQRILQTVEGVTEHETRRRRELFVVDADGHRHQVVMIREAGQWVLHRTSVGPAQQGSP